ncbi:MAG: hypothetical protein QM758_04585 [Armatimonas sp.]
MRIHASLLVALPLLLTTSVAHAQRATYTRAQLEKLERSVIGWGPMLPPKGNASTAADIKKNAAYTPTRKKLLDTFQGWIQKTYTPLGRLAEPWRNMGPHSLSLTDQPPRWTVLDMMLWAPAPKQGGGITRAQPASEWSICIGANETIGYESAFWFNTPKQFYFTMAVERDGTITHPESATKYGQLIEDFKKKLTTGPDALAPGTFVVMLSGSNYINVVLIPGGKLPMVNVSRAEALKVAEEGVRRAKAEGKQSDYMLQSELKNITATREKYKDTLNEPAQLRDLQFSIYAFNNEFDPFDNKFTRYPIYRYTPETYAKCKTDTPQWIVVRFPLNVQGKQDFEAIWKTMSEKFNYAYVYNTFFAPEKVKGQAYHVRGAK